MHHLEGRRVVDVDAVEAQRIRDEPFAVGAEADLIGVADLDPPLDRAGVAIDEDELVALRHRDDQVALVRRQHQVMRRAPDVDARGFPIGIAVDDAQRIVVGIEHDCGLCRRARGAERDKGGGEEAARQAATQAKRSTGRFIQSAISGVIRREGGRGRLIGSKQVVRISSASHRVAMGPHPSRFRDAASSPVRER